MDYILKYIYLVPIQISAMELDLKRFFLHVPRLASPFLTPAASYSPVPCYFLPPIQGPIPKIIPIVLSESKL